MINEGLKTYIIKTAERIAENKTFNLVITGIIEESCIGYYVVKLLNGSTSSTVNAKTSLLNVDANLKVKDCVYLLKVSTSGGKEVEYYIFGKVGEVNEEYANLSEWDLFEALDGAKEKIILDENGKKIISTPLILEGLNQNRTFIISAQFTTDKEKDENDYGLKIILNDKNDTPIQLSRQYFEGQPFNLKNSYQKRLITIKDINRILGSERIAKITVQKFGEGYTIDDITLEVGKLKDIDSKLSVKISVAEGSKNYFLQGINSDNDIISLLATVRYEAQILDTPQLKYFWFVEDENVESDKDEGYSDLVGAGWRCLNQKNSVLKINNEIADIVPIWNAGSSTFVLMNKSQLLKYENKIKCIVQYQGIYKESESFSVFNYNKNAFTATLTIEHNDSNIVNHSSLVEADDIITITCHTEIENNRGISSQEYQWFINNSTEPLEGANKKAIKIQSQAGRDKENESSNIDYYVDTTNTYIKCKTIIKDYSDNEIEAIDTETVSIISYVGIDDVNIDIIIETQNYYMLSESSNLTFTAKEGEDPSWEEVPSSESLEWTNTVPMNGKGYVYITSRTIWKNGDVEIKKEEWSKPKIYQKIDGGIVLWDENSPQIQQLNTFNELTQNGQKQGLEVAENGDVHLNATYIKSGTLLVGEDSNPIFKASILPEGEEDEPQVVMGGWRATANKLYTEGNLETVSLQVSPDSSSEISNITEIPVDIINKTSGFTSTKKIDTNSSIKYIGGINTNSNIRGDSLEDVNLTMPVIFYCGVVDDNNKNAAYPFYVLVDGSLYASKGQFGIDVKLGNQTIGEVLNEIGGVQSEITNLNSRIDQLEGDIPETKVAAVKFENVTITMENLGGLVQNINTTEYAASVQGSGEAGAFYLSYAFYTIPLTIIGFNVVSTNFFGDTTYALMSEGEAFIFYPVGDLSGENSSMAIDGDGLSFNFSVNETFVTKLQISYGEELGDEYNIIDPPGGSFRWGPYTMECHFDGENYTITIADSDGASVSRTISYPPYIKFSIT